MHRPDDRRVDGARIVEGVALFLEGEDGPVGILEDVPRGGADATENSSDSHSAEVVAAG